MSSYEVKLVICRIKCVILFKRIPLIPDTNKLSPPYVDGESDYFIPDTDPKDKYLHSISNQKSVSLRL